MLIGCKISSGALQCMLIPTQGNQVSWGDPFFEVDLEKTAEDFCDVSLAMPERFK